MYPSHIKRHINLFMGEENMTFDMNFSDIQVFDFNFTKV